MNWYCSGKQRQPSRLRASLRQSAAKSASARSEMVRNDSSNMPSMENKHVPFCGCFGPSILSYSHMEIVAGSTWESCKPLWWNDTISNICLKLMKNKIGLIKRSKFYSTQFNIYSWCHGPPMHIFRQLQWSWGLARIGRKQACWRNFWQDKTWWLQQFFCHLCPTLLWTFGQFRVHVSALMYVRQGAKFVCQLWCYMRHDQWMLQLLCLGCMSCKVNYMPSAFTYLMCNDYWR